MGKRAPKAAVTADSDSEDRPLNEEEEQELFAALIFQDMEIDRLGKQLQELTDDPITKWREECKRQQQSKRKKSRTPKSKR